MSKGRLEAFSDGVIAVAITLLALDLRVPSPGGHGGLAHELALQWPNGAAYLVSFLTIGIVWINHHAMLRRLESVDHAILMFNLVLLMTICVIPFSTALMAQYLTAGRGERLAAAVWAGSFLVMSGAFLAMQRHLLVVKVDRLRADLTPEIRRAILRRNVVGVAPYTLATAGALLTPYLTLVICTAVAVFYALPATTTDASGASQD